MNVLGIDGGGTKTAAIIADENGTVYMKAEVGRSNPNTMSKEDFEDVLVGLLQQLRQQNEGIYSKLNVCFAGMAGVGESNRHEQLINLLASHLPSESSIYIENDAVNALYSGTLGQPGIVQISGTGAITIGMNESGKTVRVGGWGYLFDDLGSGYDLGKQALRSVFQAYDGREQKTVLTMKLLSYFQVERVPDLIENIYNQQHPRSIIAPLSKLVIEAALEKDRVASRIVENASRQMTNAIMTCHDQLFTGAESVNVVLSGGVFTNFELFSRQMEKFTRSLKPNVQYISSVIPPVGGAVAAGLTKKGVALGENFVQLLNDGVSR